MNIEFFKDGRRISFNYDHVVYYQPAKDKQGNDVCDIHLSTGGLITVDTCYGEVYNTIQEMFEESQVDFGSENSF